MRRDHVGMSDLTLIRGLAAHYVEDWINGTGRRGLKPMIGLETEIDVLVGIDVVVHASREQPLLVLVRDIGPKGVRARYILSEFSAEAGCNTT